MNSIEYLKSIPRGWLPQSREGKKDGEPSNSELRRWLEKGSVVINGTKPRPSDDIHLPIKELIFFPRGNRVTIIKEGNETIQS